MTINTPLTPLVEEQLFCAMLVLYSSSKVRLWIILSIPAYFPIYSETFSATKFATKYEIDE